MTCQGIEPPTLKDSTSKRYQKKMAMIKAIKTLERWDSVIAYLRTEIPPVIVFLLDGLQNHVGLGGQRGFYLQASHLVSDPQYIVVRMLWVWENFISRFGFCFHQAQYLEAIAHDKEQ